MTKITFVKTRHNYDSYMDFWRLVELSEFPIIYVDEVDVSKPGVYIVGTMNGEWRPHIDNQKDKVRNAHLVLWNIERPSGSAGAVGKYGQSNRELIYNRHIDEVWVSDRRLADETHLRFVVLGSDEGLGEPGADKVYDFCHMSYEVPRRTGIYKHFTNIGPNAWPPERDDILKKSRFAVNVHQDVHPFQEPLRFALFAAYGLPIISESIYDSFPWSDEYMVYAEYDGLPGKIKQVLKDDYLHWQAVGQRARALMCHDYQFGKVVRQAVEESVGVWR